MREILFRGQTRRYGEKVRMGDGHKLPSRWVYGGVLQGAGDHSIIYGGEDENNPADGLDKLVVYTDTLGQFTGLADKNGKKIFEGDIVKATIIRDEGYTENIRNEKGVIAFDSLGMIGLMIDKIDDNTPVWSDFFCELSISGCIIDYCFEVIGNIHDNPELLEDEDDN